MQEQKSKNEKPTVTKYVLAFIVLLCLTVLTVALSYLKRTLWAAVAGALTIAVIKSSLVGGVFMHLSKERPVIFWLLILAFILFVVILALPVLGLLNGIGRNAPLFS